MKLLGWKRIKSTRARVLSILACIFAMGMLLSCFRKSVPELLTMVKIDGGTFMMGNDEGKATEKPRHEVQVSGFFMSAHEVTQAQWALVMGASATANAGEGAELPVYNISWNDAVDFCNALSEREGLKPCYTGSGIGVTCDFSADGYRLPTEAEWEFAAQGGDQSKGYFFSGSDEAAEVAWTVVNSNNVAHPVGSLKANELGLYDMSGNVWEWCWDWFNADYYSLSPEKDPHGPDEGTYRVLRGGSRGTSEKGVNVYVRHFGAHRSDSSSGFRVVRRDT